MNPADEWDCKRLTDLVNRYFGELGGPETTPEQFTAWLRTQGLWPPPPGVMERYHVGCAEEALRNSPDHAGVRVIEPSGAEITLWAHRGEASSEFLAEAGRQARDDWQGDCPPSSRFDGALCGAPRPAPGRRKRQKE